MTDEELKQLLNAAEQGNAEAQRELGKYYYNEAKDYDKAFYWTKIAAELGDVIAQRNLGIMYHFGRGTKIDNSLEIEWFAKAAKQGDGLSQLEIGLWYYNKEDWKNAFVWLEKAANQDEAEAQNYLAQMFYYGKGVKKDSSLAIKWFEKAAENGSYAAQVNLGVSCEYGNGVDIDYEKARYWYEKAAEQNYGSAICHLGWLYEDGHGVDIDYEKARYYFEKATEQGDEWAPLHLGLCYIDGSLCDKQDPEKAVYWLEKSVENGSVDAQSVIGAIYYFGTERIVPDYEKAVYWFKKGAELCNATALFDLASCYYYGKGVEKDFKKAKECLEKYIKNSQVEGEWLSDTFYMLASIVRDYSPGVKKDLFKAKEYAENSLKLGYDCEDFLDTINEELGISDSPNNRMGQFAKEIIEKKTPISEVFPEVEKVLKERFHDTWQYLQESSKKCLISALIAYISFTSVSKEQYDGMDFSNVISSIMKACEIEIGRVFYKGYREYLESNNIPASEFNPEKQRFVIEAKNIPNYEPLQSGEISGDNVNFEEYDYYRRKKYDQKGSINYVPKERDNTFTLGAVPFITESAKQQLNFSTSRDQQKPFTEKKYRKEYLINKHFLNYIKDVFKEGTFKNDDEIKEFIFRFTMKIRDITFQLRNPSSHTAIMEYWKAVYCGNAIFMKDNFLQNLLSKIKPEILNKQYD